MTIEINDHDSISGIDLIVDRIHHINNNEIDITVNIYLCYYPLGSYTIKFKGNDNINWHKIKLETIKYIFRVFGRQYGY